jgi:DNA sulfur modification protein DndD
VILDELVLDNVGVFAGRQALTLTPPPGGQRPVILIGGMNGCGKTTLLDAIQLALYGPLAPLAGRRGSYDSYLRGLIHRGVPPESGARVELAFHIFRDGGPQSFRVCRSWRTTGKGIREDLEVRLDGVPDALLTQDWAEHVESFVPRGIAALFFFDGEKIETLAELDGSRELLGTAIGSLLGLDLTERLSTDLVVLERRHRESRVPEHIESAVAAARDRLTAIQKVVNLAHQEAAAANVRLERADKHEFQAAERYRLEGGELFEQRAELISRRDHAQQETKRVEDQLRTIATDCAPLLLVRDRLAKAIDQGEAELAATRQGDLLDLLEGRDSDILQALEGAKISAAARTRLEKLLTHDRNARRSQAQQERVVAMDAATLARGRMLVEQALPAAQAEIGRLLGERARAREELAAAEHRLAAVPTEQAVKGLQEARDEAQRRRTAAVAACSQADHEHQAARAQLADAQRQYEKALNEATEETLKTGEARRIVDHAQRVRATLAAFRTGAIRRHSERIQQLVLACLQQLLRKQDFITDLQIDPESFEISFYARDGAQIQPHQLSAGERQLVAVSLLWGLAQASGRPLPVVVDTPLGRLDSSHRAHLVERYFPNASHQVLLLSTDTEIDDAARQSLHDRIGYAYHLEHDAASDATTIQDGYFWQGGNDTDAS